ncbi:hypothetical protein E1B28_011083 [Marasmius oreades]|uniref:Uncharacterized protein n=1 Tax=Marasmius oreades TaxID=181124 RepID=A0A9P7RU30_9AGAR|nr:uncharacterized protein E1B28_011083 [Marasmius oreades]KAG7089395.1 hypothetical protein E1B28_011083 [Marasmius oreades]
MPPCLKAVLTSKRIIKAGVRVEEVLIKLSDAFHLPELAEVTRRSDGDILDLSKFAKLKGIVKDTSLPLSTLAPVVLHRRFPLLDNIRNARWSHDLPSHLIDYLRDEVECVWEVYTSLNSLPSVGLPLQSQDVSVGKLVTLVLGKKEVAEGEIIEHPGYIDAVKDETGLTQRINVTSTRTAIRITHAFVPGHILAFHSQTIQWIMSRGCLAVVTTQTLRSRSQSSPHPFAPTSLLGIAAPIVDSAASLAAHTAPCNPDSRFVDNFPNQTDFNDGEEVESWDSEEAGDADEDDNLDSELAHGDDENSQSVSIVPGITPTQKKIDSRVLDDAFHFMDRLLKKLPKKHSAFKEFSHCFSRTIFTWDLDDTNAVKKVFESKGISWDYAMRAKLPSLRRRIRRFIPPPDRLYHDLKLLFDSFKDIICSLKPRQRGKFFSDEARKECENLLDSVQLGLLSDPPNFPLYYRMGKDKDGLNIYRTIRGTNSVEGGVHMPLRRTFGSLSASPELAEAMLGNQCHRRNISIGEFNRTGMKHKTHYDTWLLDEIVERSTTIGTKSSFPIPRMLATRIATSETFSIIPVSTSLTSRLNVQALPRIRVEGVPHHRDTPVHLMTRFTTKATNSYRFLQLRQRTTIPVLPVHTHAEFVEFKYLVNSNQFTVGRKKDKIDFEKLAQHWNMRVNLQDPKILDSNQRLYYKLPELLEVHYKKGIQWRAERATILTGQNAVALHPIHQLVYDSERYIQVPPAVLLSEMDLTVNAATSPDVLAFEMSVPNDSRITELPQDYIEEGVRPEDPMLIHGSDDSVTGTSMTQTAHPDLNNEVPSGHPCQSSADISASPNGINRLPAPQGVGTGTQPFSDDGDSQQATLTFSMPDTSNPGKKADKKQPKRCAKCLGAGCSKAVGCPGSGNRARCRCGHPDIGRVRIPKNMTLAQVTATGKRRKVD